VRRLGDPADVRSGCYVQIASWSRQPSSSILGVNQAGIVPANKFDIAAAQRAVALGWPGVQPVISELLEWIQDYNWPVAHTLAPFLASVGMPLAPYLRPIFEGDDEVWKYWVIEAVLADAPDELVDEFRPLLVRIADHPTSSERTEELDRVAAAALGRGRD
jgi:hypothetical protein